MERKKAVKLKKVRRRKNPIQAVLIQNKRMGIAETDWGGKRGVKRQHY